jgi:hypothetical protein
MFALSLTRLICSGSARWKSFASGCVREILRSCDNATRRQLHLSWKQVHILTCIRRPNGHDKPVLSLSSIRTCAIGVIVSAQGRYWAHDRTYETTSTSESKYR